MAAAPFRNLVGRYRADGKNPNGTSYTGEVEIRNENAMYYFIWTINSQTLYGSGTLNNNILNINWSGGLVSYVLQPNGVLQGSWANGQGTETLTPYGSSKRDEAGKRSPLNLTSIYAKCVCPRAWRSDDLTRVCHATGKGSR